MQSCVTKTRAATPRLYQECFLPGIRRLTSPDSTALLKRELQKNFTGWWLDEARMIIDKLYKRAGDPEKNKAAWQTINPFNAADTTAGNEKYLWYCSTYLPRCRCTMANGKTGAAACTSRNALDASELISRLRLRGHKEADFIQSKIPGQRSDGRRHPHSWNIIDADELMKWVFSMIK